MAKIDIIQTSFSAGEFAPSLYGRTDIAQYANACAIVENMIPRSYGPVISMPGTRYVATVSDSTLATRLVKFVFNQQDSYVIEMGDLYMRFFTNRGQVISSAAAATEDLSGISNLVAQWKFNDNTNSTTVIDSVGSYSGTASCLTVTLSTVGVVNTCFNFKGLYYVSVADDIIFSRTSATQPFSYIAWIYYTPAGGSIQTIVAKRQATSANSEYIWLAQNGKLYFSIYDSIQGGRRQWSTSSAVLNEGWNFVGVTFKGLGTDASDCNLYVNGVVQPTSLYVAGDFVRMRDTATPLKIGAYDVGTNKFADKIDNVAFFGRDITPAEIASLYNGSVPYQIATVFRSEEIADVQYTQLNDVIWLTHKNHAPQKLIRTSASSWVISNAPIIGGPFLPDNTPVVTSTGVTASTITITASATTGTVNITVSPTNSSLFTVSGSTLGHHGSYWMIGGLAQTNSTTGLQEIGYVRIDYVTNSYTATATVIKNLKVSTATNVWAEGSFSAVRGYPARVAFHERRLFYARTNYEPQTEWGSVIYDYDNFALNTEADDDALNLPLASNESNEIQWLASGKYLIASTFGGAFVTNSGSAAPITPNNANASEETGYGAESIVPKKIGNLLYYLQRFGRKLREMYYEFETDTFKAADRTILSPHILGDGAIDMEVQHNPETILYCVLNDGTLATMTREVDQQVTGWARHSTAGTYTSLTIIPSQESSYDEAWVIVERWINGVQKKYVEFFEDLTVPDRQDLCLYLHSALTYNAYESTTTSSATISLSASTGSVTVTASTAYFAGAMVGKRLQAIDQDGNTLGEGTVTATASTTSLTLSITTTFNALTYSSGRWGISVSTLSGLSHLEAKTVGILADGATESLTRTIASGAVTLGSNYFVINVGLSYDQIIYTLPKEAGSQRGTAQGKIQRYNEMSLKVNRSTQIFKYGPDASTLDDINLAFTPTVSTLYTGVLPPQSGGISMRGGYSRGAQIYLKNPNPLPIEILSIIGSLDTNDK